VFAQPGLGVVVIYPYVGEPGLTSKGPNESIAGAPGTMQDDHWRRNFALLEKHGMSWDMRIPYWHLEEGAEVAREALVRGGVVLGHVVGDSCSC